MKIPVQSHSLERTSTLTKKVRKLTIAMVTDDFLPASTGAGVHVQKMARELVRRGHRVLVLTSRRPGQPTQELWNGVIVRRFFSLSIYGMAQALPSRAAIRRVLTQEKVDIVHHHYLGLMMVQVAAVARSLGLPMIYTAHMSLEILTQPFFMKPFHGLLAWVYQRLCRKMDQIVCVSAQQVPEMRKLTSAVRVLTNPIDFLGDEAREMPRSARFVALYVGRMTAEKNVGYLLRGFRLLADRRPGAELWIAGQGALEPELRREAGRLGVADQVKFLGQVPHERLPDLYAAADVLVLPSLMETQGMVALEAMRFRRPVIVTNKIISARDLVEDGKNGYIVDPASVQDLADKLTRLCDDPALRRKMGEAAFTHFPVETTQEVGEKLESLYLQSHGDKKEDQGQTVPEVLRRHAQERPLATAFWYQVQGNWVSMGWKEYWARVEKLASIFVRYGLKPGNRVVVILPTSLEWEIIDKASLCLGLVVVGIEPHMAWEDMVRVIEETRPRALFVSDREMAVKLSGIGQGVPLPLGEDVPEGQVKGVLSSIKLAVCLERCYDLYEPFMDWATLEWEMAAQSGSQNAFPVTADSPASYILTSGTTGDPKGVVYTQGQLLLAAQSILAAMGPFEKDERTLAWLPMASPFQRNMNLAALLAGIPLYFQSDPKQLLQTMKEVRPTLLIGVPRVYEKIYLGVLEKLGRLPLGMGWIMKALLNGAMALAPRSSKERDRLSWLRRAGLKLLRRLFRPVVNLLGGQMRFMVTGSAPCREDVLLFFHGLGIPLLEAYGVSECAVPLSLNRPNDYKIGTVGRPLMSNNLNVEGGEIEVDGPAVFRGYENQSTQTNLTSGKYLSTGDVGKLDEEGYLQLVGRKGDLIKTSTGRKIAPAAIEQKLMKYLGAEQAMVVGEGRPYLVAIVCYDGGMTAEQKATFEDNLKKMNETLADHERVRRCVVLDRLFSLERGELTRTLKLRRAYIEQIHCEAL